MVEALRNFRVPSAERNTEFRARGPHIGHDHLGQFRSCAVLWKEHDNEKPQRTRPQNSYVVRVNMYCVTTNMIRGQGDGIRRNDEIAITRIDNGRVLANLGSNQQARIALGQVAQQRSQMLKRKFADWQNLFRLVVSHGLALAR